MPLPGEAARAARAARARGPSRARARAGGRGGALQAKCSCATDTSPRSQRVAELAQVRQDDVPQHRLAAEVGEQAVECGVGARSRRTGEQGSRDSASRSRDRATGWPAGLRAGKPRRLGGRDSTLEVLPHSANAPLVPVRVETEAPFRPLRLEQAVAALPGAKERRVDAGATAQLADAAAGSRHAAHRTDRGQKFDNAGLRLTYTLDIT